MLIADRLAEVVEKYGCFNEAIYQDEVLILAEHFKHNNDPTDRVLFVAEDCVLIILKDKTMLNIKDEAIFASLSGYAKQMIEMDDKSIDGRILNMAKVINKFFNKRKPPYTPRQAQEIVNFLKDKMDIHLEGKETAPAVLLLITLDYLLGEVEHIEARIKFGHYKHEVRFYIREIEKSKYRDIMFSHQRILCSME